MTTPPYQGRTITDLEQLVDRFLPTTEKEPAWLILAHARMHLANRPMEIGDMDAWELLGDYQDAVLFYRPLECPDCFGEGCFPANSNDVDGTVRCERCRGTGRLW